MAKYSKKRHLREINYKYENNPEYRKEIDKMGCYFGGCCFVLIFIIFIIIAIVKDVDSAIKWLK